MSLAEGTTNAYGDEVLCAANFAGVETSEKAEELLAARFSAAPRGVWLDLQGAAQCQLLLPAALKAGMSIHSGSGDCVTLRAWGLARTDKDPCPERAFAIHIVHCLVVRRDGSVLMVKQSYDASQLFTLPGGFIDAGESIEAAAVRETHEETGVQARYEGLLHTAHAAAFKQPTRFGHAAIVHTPLMSVVDESSEAALGETNTADEISEVQWVPRSTWSQATWVAEHCHHLVSFALQQLTMIPVGSAAAATGAQAVVCEAAAAAILAAASGGNADLVGASQSQHPSGYAGLQVEWDSHKNDGKMQIYCNDLAGSGGLQTWW